MVLAWFLVCTLCKHIHFSSRTTTASHARGLLLMHFSPCSCQDLCHGHVLLLPKPLSEPFAAVEHFCFQQPLSFSICDLPFPNLAPSPPLDPLRLTHTESQRSLQRTLRQLGHKAKTALVQRLPPHTVLVESPEFVECQESQKTGRNGPCGAKQKRPALPAREDSSFLLIPDVCCETAMRAKHTVYGEI